MLLHVFRMGMERIVLVLQRREALRLAYIIEGEDMRHVELVGLAELPFAPLEGSPPSQRGPECVHGVSLVV